MRTLVVDDDAMVRKVLRRLIERRGHEVDEADDAPAGLQAALSGDYDLVVLDHQMPGGDGASVAEAIGRSPAAATTHVLMCTTMCGPKYEARIHAAGALGLVAKPFGIAEMIAWLEVVEAIVGENPQRATAVG